MSREWFGFLVPTGALFALVFGWNTVGDERLAWGGLASFLLVSMMIAGLARGWATSQPANRWMVVHKYLVITAWTALSTLPLVAVITAASLGWPASADDPSLLWLILIVLPYAGPILVNRFFNRKKRGVLGRVRLPALLLVPGLPLACLLMGSSDLALTVTRPAFGAYIQTLPLPQTQVHPDRASRSVLGKTDRGVSLKSGKQKIDLTRECVFTSCRPWKVGSLKKRSHLRMSALAPATVRDHGFRYAAPFGRWCEGQKDGGLRCLMEGAEPMVVSPGQTCRELTQAPGWWLAAAYGGLVASAAFFVGHRWVRREYEQLEAMDRATMHARGVVELEDGTLLDAPSGTEGKPGPVLVRVASPKAPSYREVGRPRVELVIAGSQEAMLRARAEVASSTSLCSLVCAVVGITPIALRLGYLWLS